jgi:hypothetical protein
MLLQLHILVAARRLRLPFFAVFLVSLGTALSLAWAGPNISHTNVVGLGVVFGLSAATVVLLALLQVSADANLFGSPIARAIRDKMPTPYLLFLMFVVFACIPAHIFDWVELSNIFPVFGDQGRWPSFVVRGYGLAIVVADLCFWALVKRRNRGDTLGQSPTHRASAEEEMIKGGDPSDPAKWPQRIINVVGIPISVYVFYWMITRGYWGDVSMFATAPILMIPHGIVGLIYYRRSAIFWTGYAVCVIGVLIFAYVYRAPAGQL